VLKFIVTRGLKIELYIPHNCTIAQINMPRFSDKFYRKSCTYRHQSVRHTTINTVTNKQQG